MAKYNCEIFGTFTYSLEISYHELYEVEQELILKVQDTLEHFGAQHLDFWGYGDTLQVQCALAEYDVPNLESLCDELAALLGQDMRAKFVCLDKHLNELSIFFLEKNTWRSRQVDISDDSQEERTD